MPEKQAPQITMQPVESSQIAAIGYDPPTQTLAINFKTGGRYHYANVTQADWEALSKAKSTGSHFFNNIKKHPVKFPFTRQPKKAA